MGMLTTFGRFSQGGGGGGVGAHVPSNTEYFNVLLEVGGGGVPGDTHDLLPLFLPLPTTTPTPPLTYYSPSAWSEVTSMVTYVMMTNSLIHYCQSMKHIYMDTVYKLS